MFKLLAIRPLPGCAPYIQKCLKTGMMYYFCSDYIIEPYSHIRRRSKNVKPLKEGFFSIPSTADGTADELNKDTGPTVSVSAVVGMNGDGKSTLVELMMRLINNCAISYDLRVSKDNLRRVEGNKAELYYLIDNSVYRMAEEEKDKKTLIWKVVELDKDSDGGELMRWEMNPAEIKSVEESFFFTFISNYSHYAYNSNDYKKEWKAYGGEKEDDEKCWLHYIFHKNDGYLTPITLHPFRKGGNIEINNEQYLTKQRLLSVFLNAENPSKEPNSFRRVNGKDANILKLTEEKFSKLQQKTLIEYFDLTKHENAFKDLLLEIEIANDEESQKAMIMNSEEAYSNPVEGLISSRFIKPIKQIIDQDDDFCVFANSVIDWMKSKTRNRKAQIGGDIISVMRGYKQMIDRDEVFYRIKELITNAKEETKNGHYEKAMMYYQDAAKMSRELGKDKEHVLTALIYDDIALLHDESGFCDKALDYYKRSLGIKRTELRKGHLSTAITYNNAAGAYRVQGNFDKALDYCKRALDIVESKWEHLTVATIYNNLALVYEDLGNIGEALFYFLKASEIRESRLGKRHLDTIVTYINTAEVYLSKGDRDNALRYFDKALEGILPQMSRLPWLSGSALFYDSIAWVYLCKGEFVKARDEYKEALRIREGILGHNHKDTATTCDCLAWTYYCMGEYDNALRFYEEALNIRKDLFGDNHWETASTYNSIAGTYFAKDDRVKSLRYYKKALSIREKILGKDHRDTAVTYNNIAGVCMVKKTDKAYHDALVYYKEALDIWVKASGNHSRDVATTHNNMALAFYKIGDIDSAKTHFEKALRIRERVLGKNHPDTCIVYNNLANVYKAKDDYKRVLFYYKEALQIKKSILGTMNIDTAFYYNKIAWEYYRKGKFDLALDYYSKALPILETVLGTGHPDTIHYYRIMAEAYKEKGDIDEAWMFYSKTLKQRDYFRKSEVFPEKNMDNLSIYRFDEKLEQYESGEFYLQVAPKNKQEYSGKKEMGKIWVNYDGLEKILPKTKESEMPDTDKYSFLSYVNSRQLGRLDTVYRILKSYGFDWRIVAKGFSDLTTDEKCQHYIVYKVCSILSTYPKYQDAVKKDGVESLREFGQRMENCIDEIKLDRQSHITRKLRQVERFRDEGLENGDLYGRLGGKVDKTGELLVELDKLREHYEGRSFSLDNLPPPIYHWDIIFKKPENPDCIIELDSFSSGEKQMLNSIGAIIYHLQNIASASSDIKYDNINLILEEIELYYHPEYQRQFFYRLLDMIKRAKLGNIRNINIVFVTHSPFLLSDIPKCNVLFLKDGMPKDIMQENTFGANIHTLLKNGFFMPNLPIGDFAYGRINKLFSRLNSGELNPDTDLEEIYQEILLVGEPFLRNQLLMLYNSYKGNRVLPKN